MLLQSHSTDCGRCTLFARHCERTDCGQQHSVAPPTLSTLKHTFVTRVRWSFSLAFALKLSPLVLASKSAGPPTQSSSRVLALSGANITEKCSAQGDNRVTDPNEPSNCVGSKDKSKKPCFARSPKRALRCTGDGDARDRAIAEALGS